MHTHLDLPFFGTFCSDDFYTGQKAAAFGGTTSHIDFVIQPIGGSLQDGLIEWQKKAEGKTVIDYGFHMAVTDLRPEVMEEIPATTGGLYFDGSGSPKLTILREAIDEANERAIDAVFSISPGKQAVFLFHEGWAWICQK